MKKEPFIHADEIVALFKKHFGLSISRSSIYHYINQKGFPKSTGWGRPRKWFRQPVEQWFKENALLGK